MNIRMTIGLLGLTFIVLMTGCQKQGDQQARSSHSDRPAAAHDEPDKAEVDEADIKEARAGLSPEDRRLVETQDFCAVMPDKRLGVMGTPIKIMVKDQPVFLCCKGCRRKALADPDKTLAKVEELKARSKNP